MRTRTVLALALLAGVTAWPSSASANPQQAGVQIALRALGLYLGPIDGNVGPKTVAAVRAAQARFHVPVTGLIDVRTRVALGPLGRPLFGERTLRSGDFGLDVSVLQYLLLKRGLYRGALDGYLGKRTDEALIAFQRRTRLAPDGIVGPRTVAALVRQTGVPVRVQPRKKPAPPTVKTYIVRPGDTLTALAQKFGLSLKALAQRNRLNPSRFLLIGTRLSIPIETRRITVVAQATPTAAIAPAAGATSSEVPSLLNSWAAHYGVSQALVRALAWMESGYQPTVVSKAGARGVLQTLPTTRQYVEQVLVGKPLPTTVDGDIQVGVLFLRHLLQTFGGNERLALAAWYEGPELVKQGSILPVTTTFVDDVMALESRV